MLKKRDEFNCYVLDKRESTIAIGIDVKEDVNTPKTEFINIT